MKDSGVKWIGEIPVNWRVARFKYMHSGTNVGESIDKEYWSENSNDTVFYTAGLNPILTTYKDFPSWKYVNDNDLLLARNGTPYVYMPILKSVYSDHIIRVTIKNGYDKRYAKYCLQHSILSENVNVVSIATWSASLWNKQILPLTDFITQQKIADILDNKCAQIDSVLKNTRTSIEEYKKLKQAIITKAVTKGVRGDRPMKDSGIEWIGEIPKNWEVTTVLRKIDFIGGSQPPLTQFIHEAREGYVRLIQNRDYKTDAYLTFVPKNSVTKFCNADDIMIGRYGPPVFVLHRGLTGAYNVALMKAIPKGLNKQWMYYFLQEITMLEYIKSFSKRAAGQDGVDTKISKKLSINSSTNTRTTRNRRLSRQQMRCHRQSYSPERTAYRPAGNLQEIPYL